MSEQNLNQNQKIDVSRRVCTLSKKMIDMLVTQMGEELYNKHLYMTFANYFGVNGFSKLEEYYIHRAEEEELHHKWIYWYLTYCDVDILYPAIKVVDVNIENFTSPFLITVDQEIKTTMNINAIINQTLEEKDWQTFNWLHDHNKEHGALCSEQIEEESISRAAADIAQTDNSNWLKKQDAIYSLYFNK